MVSKFDKFVDKVPEVAFEAVSRAKEAFALVRQTGSHVCELGSNFRDGVLNLMMDRKLEEPVINELLEIIDRDGDIGSISPEAEIFLNKHDIPLIYYEMLQGISVIRKMPAHADQIDRLSDGIYNKKDAFLSKMDKGGRPPRVYVAGEGSSIAIPGALAERFSFDVDDARVISNCCEAEDILDCDTVIVLSNSGMTDTSVKLAETARKYGAFVVGITKDSESELARICGEENTIVLNCGSEVAVGATKSVVEQCLLVSALIKRMAVIEGKDDYSKLADQFQIALTQDIPQDMIRKISLARELVIIGSDGVHREAALKVAETIGVKVRIIDKPFALHGDEETFGDGDVILFIDPPNDKLVKIKKHIESRVPVFYLCGDSKTSEDLGYENVISVPSSCDYQPVMHLGAIQNLLIRLAIYKRKNCVPKYCRKVGDAVSADSVAT